MDGLKLPQAITIIDDDPHLPYTMDQLGAGNEEDSDRFLNHLGTCPDPANQHGKALLF